MEENICYKKAFFCNLCQSEFELYNEVSTHIELVHDTKPNLMFYEKKHNPWAVENVSVFLKYHCPECEFNDDDLKIFTHHALKNHENASVLFSSQEYKEPEMPEVKVEVEENCNFCGFNDCICTSNEVQNEMQNEDQTFDSDLKLESIEEYSKQMKNVSTPRKYKYKKESDTKASEMIKPWDIKNQILCDICPIKELSTMYAALAHRFVSFTYLFIHILTSQGWR